MSRALTSVAMWIERFPDAGTDADDPKLARFIELASQDLEDRTGRRFLTQAYARWHSGDRAAKFYAEPGISVSGDTIWAADRDAQGTVAVAPITDVGKIEENGIAVPWVYATASSFPDGELAIVDAAVGTIVRAYVTSGRPSRKAWARGYANIRVELTAGYTAHPASNYTMPANLEQLCCELANLYRSIPQRGGLQTAGEGGFNATFAHYLSKDGQATLAAFSLPSTPRTVE